MADDREAGAGSELSDEDLDDIVGALEAEDPALATEAPEPESTEPAGDEPDDTSAPTEPPDNAAGDEEEGDVPAGSEPAAPAAASPATAPAPKPFQFKASGGTHAFQGAYELADGSVVIAPQAQAEFRRVLASERELSTNFKTAKREFDRKLRDATQQRTDKDIEADAVIKMLSDIRKMSPDERFEYFEQLDAKMPALELEVKRQQLERDRKALDEQRNPTLSEEEQSEQVDQVLTSELNATFQRLEASPDAKHLTRDELIDLYRRWVKRTRGLVRRADADDPTTGIKKGTVLFDDADVWADFKFLVEAKRKAGPSAPAARNAARNADANAIPPVVQGGKVPPGPAKTNGKKVYKGKDRKRFNRDFMQGALDTPE